MAKSMQIIRRMSRCVFVMLLLCVVVADSFAQSPLKTRNVIVVTLDGFRYQELFAGADESLIDRDFGGVREPDRVRKDYWRDTAEERRATLLPFVWNTIARQGQILGDRSRAAPMTLTNGLKFSYPGYSELFCGVVDPNIRSNNKVHNANLSVLEFLNGRPGHEQRVAAFCTWGVFPFIFRSAQNGLKVHAGWTPIVDGELTARQREANARMAALPRYWPDNAFDLVTFEAANEHIARHRPRVLYIGLGETDEWAHGKRYDLYLDAARNADRYLSQLWHTLQSLSEYREQTLLLVTTDHGRGATRHDWIHHGEKIDDAEHIWLVALGPDVPALGVRERIETTQSQLAATIAQALGEDFRRAVPKAAAPLPIFRE